MRLLLTTSSVVEAIGIADERLCSRLGRALRALRWARIQHGRRMPGCPIALGYELPLGPEGLKLAKARQVSERRNAGHEIQRARKAAGLTQAQLASKAGVTRAVVAMGETSGSWGEEALRKIKHVLAKELS